VLSSKNTRSIEFPRPLRERIKVRGLNILQFLHPHPRIKYGAGSRLLPSRQGEETLRHSCDEILARNGSIGDYLEVLKPRETGLLIFIGIASAIVATDGLLPASRALLIFITLLAASAGANGLTNYLDRRIDALMPRTRNRALPSKRIFPAEKVLPLTISLIVAGLVLCCFLHPFAFFADLAGTTAALVWRKKVTCVFPQGVIASWAPVLIGWFAVTPVFNQETLLLCCLIAAWLPSHIWSIMVARRQEYFNAGIAYFPVNQEPKIAVRILLAFCILLFAASIALYFVGGFGLIYLITAGIAGLVMVYAGIRLTSSHNAADAWKMYKLSAFPYLGLIFLAMVIDIWIRH
jgi:heme o synthase